MKHTVIIDDTIRDKAEMILNSDKKTLADALGIRLLSLSREELTAEMAVDDRTVQPMRLLHGGASVALAETLVSIGAWLQLDDPDQAAVGLEINANHLRSVPEGETVTARAYPIHVGRRTQVWETRIVNRLDKLVSISRCTVAIVPADHAK